MELAWVGFDREINSDSVKNILKDKFSLLACYEYNIEELPKLLHKLNLKNVYEDPSIVFYQVIKNESEYPIVWEFISFPDLIGVSRSELVLAYYLSKALNCKTITCGYGFGLDISEYWNIVFDNGKAFLVDDLDTKFSGYGENKLKFIKEMDLQKIVKNFL